MNTTIQSMIDSNRVFLFMKGTPQSPACGFSSLAVQLLKANGVSNYGYFNVLTDDGIRSAIKEFSSWPTIPQLYVDGVFIGGSDIMREMQMDGELENILK